MSNALNVTATNFQSEVIESEIPVLVDFWAPWCGPCRMVAPILDEIASEQIGKVKIVKINVDENPDLSAQYRITSIPCMKIFKGGEVQHEIVGALPKKDILDTLAPFIG